MPRKQNDHSLQSALPSSSTNIRLQAKVDLDYDEQDLGWILRGIVEKARGCGHNPHRIFFEEDVPDIEPRHEKLLELGREIFETFPAATSFFAIDEKEWSSWYRQLKPLQCFTARDTKTVEDAKTRRKPTPRTGAAQISSIAWLAPVNGPISSRFGQRRAEGTHEGIDVAVPVGTRVVAPQAMRIEKVGYNERSGRFVVANVMRSDGGFEDSDGYRLTFAHLSEVLVEEDTILQRGQSFARSGATGKVTGPHLHFRVQWVEDGFLSDDVISIDPLAVIPEEVFMGQLQPLSLGARSTTALRQGQPINIIIAPGAGRVSAGGTGVTQPDVGIQLPLQGAKVEQSSYFGDDPLAGIVTDLVEEAPNFIRTVGHVAQAAGNIASIGGTLASFIPGAAPVAIPVAAVGSAVSASAQPISHIGASLAEVGSKLAQGEDPFDGLV